jgi:tetratricopeptide (TPR) repeat protein
MKMSRLSRISTIMALGIPVFLGACAHRPKLEDVVRKEYRNCGMSASASEYYDGYLHFALADSAFARGNAHMAASDTTSAAEDYAEALGEYIHCLGLFKEDPYGEAAARLGIANLFYKSGEIPNAIFNITKTREYLQSAFGDSLPGTPAESAVGYLDQILAVIGPPPKDPAVVESAFAAAGDTLRAYMVKPK